MAYQQVSKPRFYCNMMEFLNATGHSDYGLFNQMLPITTIADSDDMSPAYSNIIGLKYKNFIAHLGHRLATGDNGNAVNYILKDADGLDMSITEMINQTTIGGYDGFSLSTFSDEQLTAVSYVDDSENQLPVNIGTVVVGTYHDLQAPNLSLTMNMEYGGAKEITSYNGSTFSNSMWSRQPLWGNLGAWELHDPSTGTTPFTEQPLARSGRKTWQLTFSYIGDSTLFSSNESIQQHLAVSEHSESEGGPVEDDDIDYGNTPKYNILTDDSWFSQVWHRTLNGTLPFIFQPNLSDNTNFAICRFRNNLKATQTAFSVYDISVTIEEVW